MGVGASAGEGRRGEDEMDSGQKGEGVRNGSENAPATWATGRVAAWERVERAAMRNMITKGWGGELRRGEGTGGGNEGTQARRNLCGSGPAGADPASGFLLAKLSSAKLRRRRRRRRCQRLA